MNDNSKVIKEIKEFEDGFPDGIYVIQRIAGEPRLNVRAMYKYCHEKGINPNDLNDEEMERFLIYKDK